MDLSGSETCVPTSQSVVSSMRLAFVSFEGACSTTFFDSMEIEPHSLKVTSVKSTSQLVFRRT